MVGEREDQFACREAESLHSSHGLFTSDEEMMDDEVVDAAAHAVAASSDNDVAPEGEPVGDGPAAEGMDLEEMMDDEVVDAAAHAVAASSSDDVVPLPAPPMMPSLLDVPIGVADASVELSSGRIAFLPTTSVLKQVAPSG